ncbi:MAG: double-stranded RNA binding motif domain-containing protein [Christensenellaceae bacterium]
MNDEIHEDNSHTFTVRCYLNNRWIDGTGSRVKEAKKQSAYINRRLCKMNADTQRNSETVLFLFSVSILNFFVFNVYIKTER